LSIGTGASHADSSAGPPTPTSYLLCGMFTPGAESAFSGNSNVDHPSGASSMGNTYAYTGQNCESEQGKSGSGTYTWTVTHSNVHVNEPAGQSEEGTEHGQYALSADHNRAGGFNGHITNFDLSSADNTGDPCGSSRTIYYASGHQFDSQTCSPSGPGNINTHGGAATGDHFNGKYGTIAYQYDQSGPMNNSPCKQGSSNYCFEAILVGQTN
jgi:hypothetical protein